MAKESPEWVVQIKNQLRERKMSQAEFSRQHDLAKGTLSSALCRCIVPLNLAKIIESEFGITAQQIESAGGGISRNYVAGSVKRPYYNSCSLTFTGYELECLAKVQKIIGDLPIDLVERIVALLREQRKSNEP